MSQSQDELHRGFSLIELLVVIGLLGMLVGLSLPAVQQARDAAARAACLNNLRQIGTALQNFDAVYHQLPPAAPPRGANDPNGLLLWQALILPQMDQDALYQTSIAACREDAVTYHNPPHVGRATVIRSYVCPSDGRLFYPLITPSGDRAAFSDYLGVKGGTVVTTYRPGMFGQAPGSPYDGVRLTDATDGTSQTLMVGERPPPDSLQAGLWYSTTWILEPNGGPNGQMPIPGIFSSLDWECMSASTHYGPGRTDNPCDRYHFWSLHRGGANFLFADGSVRLLPYSARDVLPALATRAGGEVISLPD